MRDPVEAEKINRYVARVLRLTQFAPDMVKAILDSRQRPDVTLARALDALPMEWAQQRQR